MGNKDLFKGSIFETIENLNREDSILYQKLNVQYGDFMFGDEIADGLAEAYFLTHCFDENKNVIENNVIPKSGKIFERFKAYAFSRIGSELIEYIHREDCKYSSLTELWKKANQLLDIAVEKFNYDDVDKGFEELGNPVLNSFDVFFKNMLAYEVLE